MTIFFDLMRGALHACTINRTPLMRGSLRVRDVELVAREQRRETPTTIRQYVSFEWRKQNARAKKIASIAVERKAMEDDLLERRVELTSSLVCQVDVRHRLEHRHRKKVTGL